MKTKFAFFIAMLLSFAALSVACSNSPVEPQEPVATQQELLDTWLEDFEPQLATYGGDHQGCYDCMLHCADVAMSTLPGCYPFFCDWNTAQSMMLQAAALCGSNHYDCLQEMNGSRGPPGNYTFSCGSCTVYGSAP